METTTPLMKQYAAIKAKYPDAVLLFRVGEFYEMFGKDAEVCSEVLELVLTKRINGKASSIPLAGFPANNIELFLPRLVRAGHRVALCDQLDDPKQLKSVAATSDSEEHRFIPDW